MTWCCFIFLANLQDSPLPTLTHPALDKVNILQKTKEKDFLLHYPYQSYEPVVQFFEQAAKDPDVIEINIIQYRVAKKSRIMNALIDAAKSGKKITAFVEVKARFDEEANLRWARRLENAGVKVLYSVPGLKVHSKLALVKKKTEQGIERYCYLSTGNFHEKNAKIYTDFSLFTCQPELTKEVAQVFEFIKCPYQKFVFNHLIVSPLNRRKSASFLKDLSRPGEDTSSLP